MSGSLLQSTYLHPYGILPEHAYEKRAGPVPDEGRAESRKAHSPACSQPPNSPGEPRLHFTAVLIGANRTLEYTDVIQITLKKVPNGKLTAMKQVVHPSPLFCWIQGKMRLNWHKWRPACISSSRAKTRDSTFLST